MFGEVGYKEIVMETVVPTQVFYLARARRLSHKGTGIADKRLILAAGALSIGLRKSPHLLAFLGLTPVNVRASRWLEGSLERPRPPPEWSLVQRSVNC